MNNGINIVAPTGHLMTPAKAEALASEMNADPDDDWTYTACHDPKGTGYSYVSITDEDGEFVGKV